MKEFNFLRSLFDYAPGDSPFLSIYLNTDVNASGKKDHEKFLKKEFADHIAVAGVRSSKRSSLEGDEAKVSEYIDALEPEVKGAAIFSASGAGFFKAFEFAAAFPENAFYMFDRPRIFPLAQIVDANPRYAVALADTNFARIFVINRDEVLRDQAIQNLKTNRTEVGGWSQTRYQRHIENFHQQHAKEVAEELAKLVRNDRVDRVVLCGDEAVIIPLLQRELAEEVSHRVVAVLPLNVHTADDEVLDATEKAVAEYQLQTDRDRIEYILEHRYDAGAGVAGIEDTLRALLNGEVQELYLNGTLSDIAYNAKDIEQIFREYDLDTDIPPDVSDHGQILDELVRLGAKTADGVHFVSEPGLLKKYGGAGAILRFKAQHARTT